MKLLPRIIPCLLMDRQRLVKTVRFRNPVYVGDPINTVRILNEKEVDEVVILDVSATAEGRKPTFAYIEEIASECFMPLAYGGGVSCLDDIRVLFSIGIEKVCMNTHALTNPRLVQQAAENFGSQSIIVSVDVRRSFWGQRRVCAKRGRKVTGLDPVAYCGDAVRHGAGEILLTDIDREGTLRGYDLEFMRTVADAVSVPIIACGGASSLDDMVKVVREGGASAAAAGSLFVFHGHHRAVLINYPTRDELEMAFAPVA